MLAVTVELRDAVARCAAVPVPAPSSRIRIPLIRSPLDEEIAQ